MKLGARQKVAVALALVAIMLAAAWLRLGHADAIMFEWDEAEWSNGALSIARGESFPLTGIRSLVWVATGPVFLYILSLPMLISTDPRFVTGFVGLLNLAGVGLTFFFTRRYFGLLAALVATLLYAANPWAVYHSRKIWNPDVLPLFSLLFFWGLYGVAVERRVRYWALSAFACAVAVQLNQAGLVLIPILGLFTIVYWRRLTWTGALAAAAVALLVLGPNLYYLASHDWADIRQALQVAGLPPVVDGQAAGFALALGAGWGFPADVFGIWTRPGEAVPDSLLANAVATALLLLGLAVATILCIRALRVRRWDEEARHALLLVWLLVPVLAFTRHGFEMHIRYLLLTQPVQFVLAGLGTSALLAFLRPRLARRWPIAPTVGFAAALAPALLVSAVYFAQYTVALDLIERNGLEASYGPPAKYYVAAIDTAQRLSGELGGAPVYIRGNDRMYEPLRYLARVARLPVRQSTARDLLVLPGDGREGIYVDALGITDEQARAAGLISIPEATVAVPGGQVFFMYFKLPAGAAASTRAGLPHSGPALRLDNGYALAAWRSEEQGGTLRFTTAWNVLATPGGESADPSYCLSQHLVDGTGGELAVRDLPLERNALLQPGDVVLVWSEVPLPSGIERQAASVDFGMFRCWQRETAKAVDAAGQPRGTALRVGPFRVGQRFAASEPLVASNVLLGDTVELLGYGLGAGDGMNLRVVLNWQGRKPTMPDYTVFVQLLGEGGLVAQLDSMPRQGKYPTSLWEEGETVPDDYDLPLPPGLAPGQYRLIAGMYTLGDMRRLPVTGPDGRPMGDYVELGQVSVADGKVAIRDSKN